LGYKIGDGRRVAGVPVYSVKYFFSGCTAVYRRIAGGPVFFPIVLQTDSRMQMQMQTPPYQYMSSQQYEIHNVYGNN
jgi:hypothetical protein